MNDHKLKEIIEYMEALNSVDANASIVDSLYETSYVFLSKNELFKLVMKILRDIIKY